MCWARQRISARLAAATLLDPAELSDFFNFHTLTVQEAAAAAAAAGKDMTVEETMKRLEVDGYHTYVITLSSASRIQGVSRSLLLFSCLLIPLLALLAPEL